MKTMLSAVLLFLGVVDSSLAQDSNSSENQITQYPFLIQDSPGGLFTIRELQDLEKPEILKAYLDNFSTTVQRYLTVRAGAPAESFSAIAGRHPVFELLPCGEQNP